MMFDDIERELKKECASCKRNCDKYGCVVYRILNIITDNRERTHLIDIDEFFSDGNEHQISVFDYLEST